MTDGRSLTPRALGLMGVLLTLCLSASGCTVGAARIKDVPATRSGPEVAGRLQELLDGALQTLSSAAGIHAVLTRQERVQGNLKPQEVLDYLQRFQPHSLKIEWVGEYHAGRRMIYVEGENDDKVLVHPGGLAGALVGEVRLSLDDPRIAESSRYPPDVAGYDRLILRMHRLAARYRDRGGVSYRATGTFQVNGSTHQLFELRIDPPDEEEDLSRSIMEFDVERSLPVEVVSYNRLGELREDYQWDRLELRKTLTDEDFTFGPD